MPFIADFRCVMHACILCTLYRHSYFIVPLYASSRLYSYTSKLVHLCVYFVPMQGDPFEL